MTEVTEQHLQRLIQIESQVHYSTPAHPPRKPFVVIERESPVLISAPHGAICLRNDQKQIWHEEDEFTAGMAILLGEICNTSVIATTWKTIDSDPNYHFENQSPYKQEIRRLAEARKLKWIFDLHGAALNSQTLGQTEIIDFGTRKEHKSFNPETLDILKNNVENRLGKNNIISENKFPAYATKNQMSITAFCQENLNIDSLQIEMKPFVRIPVRRIDSSAYLSGEQYVGNKQMVIAMIQSLSDIIEYLHENFNAHK